MMDAKGKLVPEEMIKAQDKIEDEVVRKIHVYALKLSEQIARFKGHCFEDMGDFEALLAAEYGTTLGGRKGNKTLMTIDGCMKVTVQVADLLDFGPTLHIAKELVDECLSDWSENARPEIRAVVNRAFNVEKEGNINRSELFMLLRLDIDDPRWQQAMQALRDAIRVLGSKEYVRFYRRSSPDAKWEAVTIDLAKV